MVVLFLTTFLIVNTISGTCEYQNSNGMIYVDDDNKEGPWNGTLEHPYRYIQDAIDNASDGDIVYVFNGVYYEDIVVYKSLTLIGETKTLTIIDGMYKNSIIHVSANFTYIQNVTIRNSGGNLNNAGIKIDSIDNQITNCIVYRTKSGIYINKTHNNIINNCTFSNNGEGIFLQSTLDNTIRDCYFCHNGIGLNIRNSDTITITGCYAHTNGIAFFFDNSSTIESVKCAAYNNNDNQGGFFIDGCKDITLLNCNIYHNGFGTKLFDSSNIHIKNCNFLWNTHFGIDLNNNSENIIIEQCNLSRNFRYAIQSKNSNFHLLNNNFNSSICGLNAVHSQCCARYNWWGSPFGPSVFERESKDRIFIKCSRIRLFPWHIVKVKHAGTNWEVNYDLFKININNTQFRKIKLPGNDTDNDNVPDWWEEKWGYDKNSWNNHGKLDPDKDGLNNIEECYTDKWDSNPYFKDVFLELDWVATKNPDASANKLADKYVNKFINSFQNHNITLHIDEGTLGGGEEIPYSTNFSYADLRDLYWEYFLHNDLNNPRKGIFHYCLVCDYGAGPGFAFIGWYNLDAFQISAQLLKDNHPQYSRQRLIAGGTLHELGHTFGLTVDDHGGNDNMIATRLFTVQWWKYKNYKSCMNYQYTYIIINYSDGSHGNGDFDDWTNLDFMFFKNTHFKVPK
jgi:parallel beta-helix repeat protein